MCVADKTGYGNLNAFNLTTKLNESKTFIHVILNSNLMVENII